MNTSLCIGCIRQQRKQSVTAKAWVSLSDLLNKVDKIKWNNKIKAGM